MIRHVVLFKFKAGKSWADADVQEAERSSLAVSEHVPELREWKVGRNVTNRADAYDFCVIGLVDDEAALERYLTNAFHQWSAGLWRHLADWVVVDLRED